MTQKEMIRAHLLQGKSITPLDALRDYGCFRLAARIEQLRKEGLQVKTESETRNGKSYARYVALLSDAGPSYCAAAIRARHEP